jgi:single-strand DNA-binding protein
MNSLNSFLIEGNLLDDPVENDGKCTFVITSDRFYKNDEEVTKETSYFTIEVFGKLGKARMYELKKNRGVRVVGRIKQLGIDSKMAVVAEHIEFKPKQKE